VALADELLQAAKEFDPSLGLTYNKYYIGISKEGQPYNFSAFRPRKQHMILDLKLQKSEDVDSKIEAAGLDALEYNVNWGRYRLRLTPDDVHNKQDTLKELMRLAYINRGE